MGEGTKDFFLELVTNRVLMSAIAAWAIAQGTKIAIEFIKHGVSLKRLAGCGGMPSAHGATVTGLATAALIVCGPGSAEFPIAMFFAIIVIYDARNVRYETGRQAAALNRLRQERIQEGKDELYPAPMEEKMGHTIPELIAGCILGAAVAAVVCLI